MAIHPLPLFPSTQARKALSASQHVRLFDSIAAALQSTLELPPLKMDLESVRAFVTSYAKEAAQETLDRLIWESSGTNLTRNERSVRSQSLELAKRLATLPQSGGLSLTTLTDLTIAYAQRNASRVRDIWSSSLSVQPNLLSEVSSDMVPSFTALLEPESISHVGLYGIRKSAFCLTSITHTATSEMLSSFSRSKPFMISLAKAYDASLLAVSRTYGGLRLATGSSSQAEEWETIWMETKKSLLDSFHRLIRHMLEVIGSATPGHTLAAECDHAFDLIYALLNVPPLSDLDPSTARTPFYDRSLIADYQYAYDMSKTLGTALRKADVARTDLLDAQLRNLDSSNLQFKGPGALKLLIRSSGLAPGAAQKSTTRSGGAAGPVASASSSQPMSADPEVEAQITQVRELLPDYAPTYIRALLVHPDYPFRGSPERVIEALLEGRAPPPNEIEPAIPQTAAVHPAPVVPSSTYTAERRNVFDGEQVDVSKIRIGKKTDTSEGLRQDRDAIERMKADILRRVEEMDEEDTRSEVSDSELGIKKDKVRDIAYEEELEEEDRVRVTGDGSAESETEEEDGTDGEVDEEVKMAPETVLELAYIRDSKLFERDAQTRRGKARADLKEQTGWGDEQIEGWKIMFERMPQAQRNRILEKHEFRGNKPLATSENTGASGSRQEPVGTGRGRGGRGRGGRGRGGRGRGGGGGDRAWKDKNKASQGNHNRKRGHDKKLARAGVVP